MEKTSKTTTEHFKTQEIDTTEQVEEAPKKRRFEDLPPAAQRALKEAEQRRAEIDAAQKHYRKSSMVAEVWTLHATATGKSKASPAISRKS